MNGLLILSSLLVALVLAEIGLRLAVISYPTFSRFRSDVGDSLLPGAEGWYTKEGRAYIRINSAGLRDTEHPIRKPANAWRIAVLGDSYAEAMQVAMEESFPAVLERELGSCSSLQGKEVEVINFGVSGYGTAQELLTLRHRAQRYQPDLVLLAFVTGNDIRNNSKELQKGGRPYFVFEDGELVLDNSFMQQRSSRFRTSAAGELMYKLLPHSRVMQLLASAGSFRKHREEKRRDATKQEVEGYELGLDAAVYKQPDTPAWSDAWAVTESLLRLMHSEVKAKGAQLLLATLSNGIQVNPDRPTRERFIRALGVKHLFYPDRRIETLANDEGIAFLMLAPHLRAWAEANGQCVHGFSHTKPCTGHWNELDHRLGGELIASRICRELADGRLQPARPD